MICILFKEQYIFFLALTRLTVSPLNNNRTNRTNCWLHKKYLLRGRFLFLIIIPISFFIDLFSYFISISLHCSCCCCSFVSVLKHFKHSVLPLKTYYTWWFTDTWCSISSVSGGACAIKGSLSVITESFDITVMGVGCTLINIWMERKECSSFCRQASTVR